MFSRQGRKPINLRRAIALLLMWVFLLPIPAVAGPNDTAWSETLGTFVSSSAAAIDNFGKVDGILTNVRSGSFIGFTGSKRRALSRKWNKWFEWVRGKGRAAGASVPYKFAPWALLTVDVSTSVIAPALEGDMKGAAAGVVNIGGASGAVSAGSALLGSVGSGVGAAVGSFFPVIGTAAGTMVGGAVGNIAGGFLAAAAYDIYAKQSVGDLVEGAIASLFDPRTEAIRAREAFLRRQTAVALQPYWDDLHMVSEDFDMNSVELLDLPPLLPTGPGADQPDQQVPVMIATSFDAVVVSTSFTLPDGSVFSSTGDDILSSTGSDDCVIFSFREGYFLHECEITGTTPSGDGSVRYNIFTTVMGKVRENHLDGWQLTYWRNFDVDTRMTDPGEYMRVFEVQRVSGEIGLDGWVRVHLEMVTHKVWDMETVEGERGYRAKTGKWKLRERVPNDTYVFTDMVLKIVGTEPEGTLRRPAVTADSIARRLARGFRIDPVFFQHGVRLPPF